MNVLFVGVKTKFYGIGVNTSELRDLSLELDASVAGIWATLVTLQKNIPAPSTLLCRLCPFPASKPLTFRVSRFTFLKKVYVY